ncbi:hypothetical protein [Pseudomonas mediterranea]|uniref:hypothetical protein n=1 Tax=Pseudomonas mediterranea TaxID=183795 RepID=UPI0006D8BA4B|nr:hypothetical protein [Pseudomonas mediterranea]
MVPEVASYASTLTKEEAEYLEALGFVPSSWSASVFVLIPAGTEKQTIAAVIERRPFSDAGPRILWSARRSGQSKNKNGEWVSARAVEHNDLTALVVMAKLEEIF